MSESVKYINTPTKEVLCDKASCEYIPKHDPRLVVPGEPAWPAQCTITLEYSPSNPDPGITVSNPDVCGESAALALAIALSHLLRR